MTNFEGLDELKRDIIKGLGSLETVYGIEIDPWIEEHLMGNVIMHLWLVVYVSNWHDRDYDTGFKDLSEVAEKIELKHGAWEFLTTFDADCFDAGEDGEYEVIYDQKNDHT